MVIIGLSANQDTKNGSGSMPKDYVLSVLRAGALPIILPMIPEDDPQYDKLMDKIIDSVHGIVFTGGPDLDPVLYKEARLSECHEPVSVWDKADLALFSRAYSAHKPFLAICRGIQVCNVALGGTLYQDLPSQLNSSIMHQQTGILHAHQVQVAEGSLLKSIVKSETLPVTSRHHQSIKQVAQGLKVSAISEDGVIEAVEFTDDRPGLCVQWHPENLAKGDERQQALFDWLVSMAKKHK
jgi:putative glutamine amidotransferase